MKSFNVCKDSKLSTFLIKEYEGLLSYGILMKLLRNKDIKVNDKRINKDVKLLAGDRVDVYYDGDKNLTFDVVYQDENIIVFNKGVNQDFEEFTKSVKDKYPTSEAVHRLDRNTSGLIIYSLNSDAKTLLEKAFKERTIEKHYLAEIIGFLSSEECLEKAYLVKDSQKGEVKIYKEKVDGSVQIITKFKTIKKLDESSIVDVELITGKTHQIRAHLAYLHHPIIGDSKYGDNLINKKYKEKYQRLTAYKLKFNFENGTLLSYLNEIEIVLKNVRFLNI